MTQKEINEITLKRLNEHDVKFTELEIKNAQLQTRIYDLEQVLLSLKKALTNFNPEKYK